MPNEAVLIVEHKQRGDAPGGPPRPPGNFGPLPPPAPGESDPRRPLFEDLTAARPPQPPPAPKGTMPGDCCALIQAGLGSVRTSLDQQLEVLRLSLAAQQQTLAVAQQLVALGERMAGAGGGGTGGAGGGPGRRGQAGDEPFQAPVPVPPDQRTYQGPLPPGFERHANVSVPVPPVRRAEMPPPFFYDPKQSGGQMGTGFAETLASAVGRAVSVALGPEAGTKALGGLRGAFFRPEAGAEGGVALTGLGKAATVAGIGLAAATVGLKEFHRVAAVTTEILRTENAERLARFRGDPEGAAVQGLKKPWEWESIPLAGLIGTGLRKAFAEPGRQWQIGLIETQKQTRQALLGEAQNIAAFSPAIAVAQAQGQIAAMQGKMRAAATAGGELADLTLWDARRTAALQAAQAAEKGALAKRDAELVKMQTFLYEIAANTKDNAERAKILAGVEEAMKGGLNATLDLKALVGKFRGDWQKWVKDRAAEPKPYDYFDLLFKKQADNFPHQIPGRDQVLDGEPPPIEPVF